MELWLNEGACDGFTVTLPYLPQGLEDVTQRLVPVLQRRGLFRREYEGSTLREHLGLPRPKNRFFEGNVAHGSAVDGNAVTAASVNESAAAAPSINGNAAKTKTVSWRNINGTPAEEKVTNGIGTNGVTSNGHA